MRNVIDAGWAVMDVEGCPCDEDFPRRTEKACGPDTLATLVSSSLVKQPRAMVAIKPVHQGEHVIIRKAIACGDAG